MEPITLATSALLVGGVATRVTRNTEVRARFRTWLAAAPVVLIPLILLGPWGAVALASVLGVIAATEYARLSCLRRVDALLLAMVVGLLPVGILVNPLLTLATVSLALPLGSAIAPVLHGDSFEGARRSAATCFGIVWLGGGLAGIGLLEPAVAAAVCIAVAVADVGAWCGGRWLGRSGPLSKGLSSLSPSKTWAGVLGAAIAGTGVLALLLCRMLAGGFPVRRNGGGSADLAQATQLLRAGHAMIIYPEGTRSRRGRVGSFHLGPARLACAAGVPLVPVGLSGTARLLPAGGRLRPGPVSVRIGAPIAVPDTEAGLVEVTRRCRVAVIGRCALPISKPDSVARRRISRLALSRWGVVAVAQWSFAEGLWWPLVPEVALFIVLLAAPQRWRVLIPVAVLANVAGGLATLILTGSGISTPQPLVTDQMRQTVSTQVREGGVAAVEHQPLAGIPFKVYAAEAGRVGLHPVEFARESLLVRGTRIAVLGLIFAIIGTALRRRPQAYPYVVAPALLSFLIGLGLVVVSWS